MIIPGSFQTVAEISIGFAGFSGLIVALRKDAGPLTDVQKYRLQVLLALSFGAMFLSLLPETLASLDINDDRVWIVACTAMSVYSTVFLLWWVLASRRIVRLVPEIFHWSAFSRMAAGHAVNLLLQLGIVFSILDLQGEGILSIGLIWYLIHAAQQFARMLFIQPKKPSP
jgi:hypothetical protein